MRMIWIVLSLVLIFLIGGVISGCFIYQHHLSGDVRRLLVAANDEHASEIEVRQYIAQARPLIRTQKDKEVFGQFEKVFELLSSIEEDQRVDSEEREATLRSIPLLVDGNENDGCMGGMYKLTHIEDQYARMGMNEPKDLKGRISVAYQDGKECRARKNLESEEREVREKSNRELALKAADGVRLSLGLPLISNQ